MNNELYHFQRIGVWKIHRFKGRVLLGDDMGLGKTPQIIKYMEHFLDGGPYIVVCPATIKYNWKQEVSMWAKGKLRVEVLEGRKPPRDAHRLLRNAHNTIFAVNHDILGSPYARNTWGRLLKSLRPTLVIGDEGQDLTNPKSKRSRNFKALIKGVKNVIIATGTPTTGRPILLWALWNYIKPKLFPSMLAFGHRYCKPRITPWGPKFDGATRTKELHRLMKENGLIRRRKKDVLKDLPAKHRTIIPVPLSDYAEYQRAERDLISWLRETSPRKANSARRAERFVRIAYLRGLVARLKQKAIQAWVDSFLKESREKLIIFGVHKGDMVVPLHERYKKVSVRVDGSVTKKKRWDAIQRFIKNKDVRLFIGNIKAAGTGWSGKGISNTLFTEFAWRPADHTQAEDRTHGLGRGSKNKKKRSMFYYLVARGTIEEKMIKSIQGHQEVMDRVLDGKRNKEGFDIGDLLEEYLLNRASPNRRRP